MIADNALNWLNRRHAIIMFEKLVQVSIDTSRTPVVEAATTSCSGLSINPVFIFMTEAKRIFGEIGIKLCTEKECHLIAELGSDEYRASYVKTKISRWIKDVEQL